jgi:hypothetical protein
MANDKEADACLPFGFSIIRFAIRELSFIRGSHLCLLVYIRVYPWLDAPPLDDRFVALKLFALCS